MYFLFQKQEVMEKIYETYTKQINGKTFYFVKKFSVFTEYENCPKILDSMGMHTDFYKACDLAKIYDESTVNKLMDDLHIMPDSARVIHMSKVKSVTHSFLKNTHHAISKLRWASIN
jgi:hypothetical protein